MIGAPGESTQRVRFPMNQVVVKAALGPSVEHLLPVLIRRGMASRRSRDDGAVMAEPSRRCCDEARTSHTSNVA
jgi:hypothetical protein